MSTQTMVDPGASAASSAIQRRWLDFYMEIQPAVLEHVRKNHPRKDGESEKDYEGAVKARAFDITRGFLPAGVRTQLSWHTDLRQAVDHFPSLCNHPLAEVRDVGGDLQRLCHKMYPDSGFGSGVAGVSGIGSKSEGAALRAEWEQMVGQSYAYDPTLDEPGPGTDYVMRYPSSVVLDTTISRGALRRYEDLVGTRPRGCVLPHFLSDLGQITFRFMLDFGSFRDIQRHRNGVCRMPLLTLNHGFEDWYLESLPRAVLDVALGLIEEQRAQIAKLPVTAAERQYYIPLGYRVPTRVTYGLPATLYTLEIRSGKTVHPTLRRKILQAADPFIREFPEVRLHVDHDPDDWSIRRGRQTITEKVATPS